jgi:hypothetical protein
VLRGGRACDDDMPSSLFAFSHRINPNMSFKPVIGLLNLFEKYSIYLRQKRQKFKSKLYKKQTYLVFLVRRCELG